MKIIEEKNIILEDEGTAVPGEPDVIPMDPEADKENMQELNLTPAEQAEQEVFYDWMQIVIDRNKDHRVYDIDDLGQALEKQLENNRFNKDAARSKDPKKAKKFQPSNILIVGPPGGGKTGIINDWAQKHVFNNDEINVKTVTGAQLTSELVRGVPANTSHENKTTGEMEYEYTFLNSKYFDDLDRKNSILFIDEINTAPPQLTGALLTLVQDHYIPRSVDTGSKEKSQRDFNNFLFTIAAMNPITAFDENGDFDAAKAKKMAAVYGGANSVQMALLTRFKVFTWESKPKLTRDYLLGKFKDEIENYEDRLNDPDPAWHVSQDYFDYAVKRLQGYSDIISALIRDDEDKKSPFEFEFSNNDDLILGFQKQRPVLNARTLEMCIQDCDGTVEDFLKEFKPHCGDDPKVYKAVVALLNDLQDSQVNANTVFSDYVTAFDQWYKSYRTKNGIE